jgi:superfamily II DNA or RNA helicase
MAASAIASAIRDNYQHGKAGDFLKAAIRPNAEVSVVSAYFTIHAYHQLKSALDNIKQLRFLFGEPAFIQSIDPDRLKPRGWRFTDDTLLISPERQLAQKSIAQGCAAWIREKVAIRSVVKPNFLHGKLYHITQENGVEKALLGSSNFTVHGLGLGTGTDKNIELNLVVDSDRDRSALKAWFDDLWDDTSGLVEEVKAKTLAYLEQLYAENAPEFIYFKTLYHIFGDYLADQQEGELLNEKTGFFDSKIWNVLYDFQKDGVKGAINKILKHAGCIIADSVGLGKTYEALGVIKYFEILNARVLVLCPKKLSGNWTVYQASMNNELNPFKEDRFNYTVLYHTDMGRVSGVSSANSIPLETFNWSAYDLVVIDESHNFRGNPEEKRQEDGSVKMNRAQWLMEKIIKAGAKTKVLMLSATPVNNNLRDLRNQIFLITEGNDTALLESCAIKSIGGTLKLAQNNFTRWAAQKNSARSTKGLLERLDASFFKLLDELTIARSRKHIVNFYDMTAMGNFPRREKPVSLYPGIDKDDRFPSYERINRQIEEYKLSVFNPSRYVKAEKKKHYERPVDGKKQFTQADREHFLIGMIKVNFLKRLESSIESFEITLDRTIGKIDTLQAKIAAFIKSGKSDQEEALEDLFVSIPAENALEEDTEDAEAWLVGKKLKYNLADLQVEEWLKDLRNDRDALIDLYNNAGAVSPSRDAKLIELKRIIKEKVEHPFNPHNKKVLVFTAFSDTAQYLYENLEPWIRSTLKLHAALVYGSASKTTYGKNSYDHILLNFSPRSKRRTEILHAETEDEIDILIATDCISEGQNLQDCDYLINYDIHWNPVRIIQRFGRIDRIGSRNEIIKLVNFWPTKDLDQYINLKTRVEARMALVDLTATGDDNILRTDQMEELISEDLHYRNQQLKRLQHEILELEDMEGTISLTDFTLDDFRIALSNYMNANKQRLQDSPLGLYAVVPSPGGEYGALALHQDSSAREKEIIKPGVIFCLRQKKPSLGNETVNPLNPYFLLYIRHDGVLRYNFTQGKQVLELYRLLCQGAPFPYDTLCGLFNTETKNGADMSRYAALLKQAADEAIRLFKRKEAGNLVSSRSALLIPEENQIAATADFELITWLIIK